MSTTMRPSGKNPVVTPRIRVEDAFEATSRAAVWIVDRFQAEAGEWPDFRFRLHLETLGPILDVRGVLQRHPGITGYDVAYALLRHLAEAAPYSPLAGVEPACATAVTGGLIGRVYYNPPPREFEFRRRRLDALQAEGEEERVAAIGVWLAQYLRAANKTIRDTVETSESARKQFVDWFSNPYLWLESRYRRCLDANGDGVGVAGLSTFYESIAESANESQAKYV